MPENKKTKALRTYKMPPRTAEHRKNLSLAQTGKKHTAETINKIKVNRAGKGGGTMPAWRRKNISIALKGKPQPWNRGENSHLWQGGITPLVRLIRNLVEYRQWQRKIFERDNYTCQQCFQVGGYLEVHHRTSFRILFNEFLKKYNQFSPIEEIEILARLARTHDPFLDVSNGEILCENCHKQTANYASRGK